MADPKPAGTGQEGATSPAGTNNDSPTTTNPDSRVERAANDMAKKGFERQRHDDATEFTK